MAEREEKGAAPDGDARNGRTRGKGATTGAWTEDFLEHYEATGDVLDAMKSASVGRAMLYRHRKENEEFAARWKEIRDIWIQIGRERCSKRWVDGAPKTLFLVSKRDPATGEVTYRKETVREHSPAREHFWLTRMLPEEFAPTASETGSAAEFAQRIHEALGQIEQSMDEDQPEEES